MKALWNTGVVKQSFDKTGKHNHLLPGKRSHQRFDKILLRDKLPLCLDYVNESH